VWRSEHAIWGSRRHRDYYLISLEIETLYLPSVDSVNFAATNHIPQNDLP